MYVCTSIIIIIIIIIMVKASTKIIIGIESRAVRAARGCEIASKPSVIK